MKVSSIILVGLLGTAALVFAGPLNPPGGAVASTYKTLTEVEPRIAVNDVNTPGDASSVYVITQPGSYYLTSNINVVNKNGIRIAASGVQLDLNGFQINAASGALAGITASSSPNHCAVSNGTIAGFPSGGVVLTNAVNARVSGVKVTGGGTSGIDVGYYGIVTDCDVSYNTGIGFVWNDGSQLSHCHATFNTVGGFISGYGSSTFIDCSSTHNGGDGFQTNNSVLTGCVADTKGGFGFVSTFADLYSNCRAGYNTKSGFLASNGATFDACTSVQNKQLGISAGSLSTVRNCNVESNSIQGIKVVDRSTVIGNNVQYNGTLGTYAGIWCSGDNNHVEANQSKGNAFGVFVSGTNNTVIRNMCSGNSSMNYSIVAGNRVGTVTGGTTNTAIAGNTGGGMGITDPNANLAF